MIDVTAFGRLVKDPSVEYNGDGKPRCSFTLACDYFFGKKDVTFINCKLFGKRAEVFAEHMTKGAQAVAKGPLSISEYNGKWYTNLLVTDFEFGAKPRQKDNQYHQQEYPQNNQDEGSIPF